MVYVLLLEGPRACCCVRFLHDGFNIFRFVYIQWVHVLCQVPKERIHVCVCVWWRCTPFDLDACVVTARRLIWMRLLGLLVGGSMHTIKTGLACYVYSACLIFQY
jgi:hypothetical protein